MVLLNVWCILFASWGDDTPEPGDLSVDPRLLAQAAQVWELAASEDNPLWPGWNASSTPLLFYLPGHQDVLINHPRPPSGFHPARGLPEVPGFDVHERRGETWTSLDGQNTAQEIGGVRTLVVADTLSNVRQQLDGRSTLEGLSFGALSGDPYDQMAMIAHEAFHVFQYRTAPSKTAAGGSVSSYPLLDVANTVGLFLEGEELAAIMRADSADEVEDHAMRWLATRQARRATMSEDAVAFEDGNEWTEGLAKYVEYRLFECLEGCQPVPGLRWVQHFHGFDDLSSLRNDLIAEVPYAMSGRLVVNNDPYGAAPARMRLYYSGMAIAVLLDRLGVEWHDEALQPGTTLTGLALDALQPSEAELAEMWSEMQTEPGYDALVQRKEALREAGEADNERFLRSILEGDETRLVIDYSGLSDHRLDLSYTPFGVRPLTGDRAIYSLVPVGAGFAGGGRLQQTRATPVLIDRARGTLTFALEGTCSAEDVAQAVATSGGVDGCLGSGELVLRGVRIHAPGARLSWDGERLVIRLLPS